MYKNCGYYNFQHQYNVSPVHFHALLGVGYFTKGGPRVRWPPMKWSTVAENLRNTVVEKRSLLE
jgi:hypothetical protein